MIKEVIRFRLRLGPQTDEFLARYREVATAMKALAVEPGIAWTAVAGQRQLIVRTRAFLRKRRVLPQAVRVFLVFTMRA